MAMWRCAWCQQQINNKFEDTWWHHQMEAFSALLALCAGNSSVTGEFPSQMPVPWSFDVFFDLRLNKRFNKLWRRWWFETPSHSLWCHCNALEICSIVIKLFMISWEKKVPWNNKPLRTVSRIYKWVDMRSQSMPSSFGELTKFHV